MEQMSLPKCDCKENQVCDVCQIWIPEISRLKAELSEAKSIINDLTGRHGMQTGDMSGNSFEWRTKYTIIERQLAEARASVQQWIKTAGENQLKRNEFADAVEQAHREGWEQAKREAVEIVYKRLTIEQVEKEIAAMEYGGKANVISR